jgi:hypothetical protein
VCQQERRRRGNSAHSGFPTRGLQMSKLSTLLEVENE